MHAAVARCSSVLPPLCGRHLRGVRESPARTHIAGAQSLSAAARSGRPAPGRGCGERMKPEEIVIGEGRRLRSEGCVTPVRGGRRGYVVLSQTVWCRVRVYGAG